MTKPAARIEPLPNARHANSAVLLMVAPPASRITLRATVQGATIFAKSLGFDLPVKPKTSTSKGSVHALWIGPDEWLVYDETHADKNFVPKLPNAEFSAVDISHRLLPAVDRPAGGCVDDLDLDIQRWRADGLRAVADRADGTGLAYR